MIAAMIASMVLTGWLRHEPFGPYRNFRLRAS